MSSSCASSLASLKKWDGITTRPFFELHGADVCPEPSWPTLRPAGTRRPDLGYRQKRSAVIVDLVMERPLTGLAKTQAFCWRPPARIAGHPVAAGGSR
jgi:hypothetical protein